MYGLDTGLFWIIPEDLLSRANIVLEYVSTVNDILIVISVFLLNFS